ncbi:hypothetical protein N7537_010140 [Penicillium hordei]|uniref:Uncharacterized protein n=1 Tax=Penicillium hordei TaxID=40994 RepID=A0AAD6GVF8_9EURO|nr:uncharacterized protein N7537_010140 [Penicillium hordei]KAJ5593236.1 hypothetical protein N7537_010140 [Penicillium hordei]
MQTYTLVSANDNPFDADIVDSDENLPSSSRVRRSIWLFLLGYVWKTALLAMAIVGCINTLRLAWPQINHNNSSISCWWGESLTEAMSLNCRFDSILVSWLPARCRDDELAEQCDHAGPGPDGSWTFYADENKTQTLDRSGIAALAGSTTQFYASHEWHVPHCAWFWRKQVRAAQTGVTIEERFKSVWHVEHCEMMFKRRGSLDDIIAHTGVALGGDRNISTQRHQ